MDCRDCRDTGTRTGGTGHRLGRYPYTEGELSENCTCAAGRALLDKDLIPVKSLSDYEDEIEAGRQRDAEALKRDGKGQCAWCTMPALLDDLWQYNGHCRQCEGLSE